MTPVWNQLWSEVSLLEELATAGSGTANALYFGAHSLRGGVPAPRRTAALILVALFAGSALTAVAELAFDGGGALWAAVRLPLLLGNLATFSLILAGAGR